MKLTPDQVINGMVGQMKGARSRAMRSAKKQWPTVINGVAEEAMNKAGIPSLLGARRKVARIIARAYSWAAVGKPLAQHCMFPSGRRIAGEWKYRLGLMRKDMTTELRSALKCTRKASRA